MELLYAKPVGEASGHCSIIGSVPMICISSACRPASRPMAPTMCEKIRFEISMSGALAAMVARLLL